MPDTADYLTRIRDHVHGKDPLQLQQDTPQILAELLSTASDRQLTSRPAEGKWSIGEILAHLAEDEIATAWRYRQMLEHDGLPLEGFDQDLWARTGDYGSRAPQDSLTLFRLLRNANLQFLRQIGPDEWERHGVHSERGRMTIRDLAIHMAGHDINHIEQIRTILAGSSLGSAQRR